jgi:hypothetical protein
VCASLLLFGRACARVIKAGLVFLLVVHDRGREGEESRLSTLLGAPHFAPAFVCA